MVSCQCCGSTAVDRPLRRMFTRHEYAELGTGGTSYFCHSSSRGSPCSDPRGILVPPSTLHATLAVAVIHNLCKAGETLKCIVMLPLIICLGTYLVATWFNCASAGGAAYLIAPRTPPSVIGGDDLHTPDFSRQERPR